ncbi:hypothetical protein F0562_010030 [Nyssa sinensis]|uniref:Uncharacterized protein n=1 Tax=Nyssa sinensis TaxID=561372 RepID=A0A5J5A2Q2_9ASTE|nr:hypothetical protein F0562_010030 [Nyssa sinensis]
MIWFGKMMSCLLASHFIYLDLLMVREGSHLEENHYEMLLNNFPVGDHGLNRETLMLVDDHSVQKEPEPLHERGTSMTGSHREGFPRQNGDKEGHGKNQSEDNSKKRQHDGDNGDREGHENRGPGKNQSGKTSKKRKRGKGKRGRGSGDITLVDTHNAQRHSPAKMTGSKSLDRHPLEHLETPSTDVGIEGYRHFGHSNAGSHSPFPTGYSGTWADDQTMRYGLKTEEPFSSIPQRWSRGASPIPDFLRASTDGRGYRTYMNEMDERYGRDSNIQQQVRLYGQQDPNSLAPRNNYSAGQNPGFSSPYGHVGLAGDSSYSRMNTSAMQRYAPRLDELNHSRMNTLVAEPSVNRSSIYDPPLASQPGYRPDSLGYAPGPYNTFSQRNSSGWLND